MNQPEVSVSSIKPFDFAALISFVDRIERSKEAKIWEESPEQMRILLWNLAGMNTPSLNNQFKRDWLKLPNDAKARVRAAIHEMCRFVKSCDALGVSR